MLSIKTAEEDNEEQLAIAEMNPFRYRGYYYDNETGMYYLQSRYYNPELCRFISADGFDYLDTTNTLNANAYIYCWNCPVAFDDNEGTTPKLSINLTDIVALIKNINDKIKDGVKAEINQLTEKLNKLADNLKNTLKKHYNNFIDKLEYAINYPDAVINSTLSKILNKDVNIRFRLVEFLREQANLSIDLSGLKVDVDEDESGITPYYIVNDEEKTDNWFVALIKALAIAIPVNSIALEFEAVVQTYDRSFNLSSWFENLSNKTQNLLIDMGVALSTFIHTAYKELGDQLEGLFSGLAFDKALESVFEKTPNSGFIPFIGIFMDSFDIIGNAAEGTYSFEQSALSFIFDTILTLLPFLFPESVGVGVAASVIKIIGDGSRGSIFNYQNGYLWG
ncbi:MAG: RHS repeat-associated core domain-containing protein [Clostridium sp.]|nr:RHS repeat-associated core domain-containing protein [Clostridium sp.]